MSIFLQLIPCLSVMGIEKPSWELLNKVCMYVLRQVLRFENHNPSSCNKSECATSSVNLCFAKNVVYRITCTQCKQCYIGSTIRNLHDRTKEHLSKPASSVYKHFTNKNNHDTREEKERGQKRGTQSIYD